MDKALNQFFHLLMIFVICFVIGLIVGNLILDGSGAKTPTFTSKVTKVGPKNDMVIVTGMTDNGSTATLTILACGTKIELTGPKRALTDTESDELSKLADGLITASCK